MVSKHGYELLHFKDSVVLNPPFISGDICLIGEWLRIRVDDELKGFVYYDTYFVNKLIIRIFDILSTLDPEKYSFSQECALYPLLSYI